jgi:hypothetical protein
MALPDLRQLKDETTALAKRISSFSGQIVFNDQITRGISDMHPYPVVIKPNEIQFRTSAQKASTKIVSNFDVLKAAAAVPLYRGMSIFRDRVQTLRRSLNISDQEFKEMFRDKKSPEKLPERWDEWEAAIQKNTDLSEEDKKQLTAFIIDPDAVTSHKGLGRSDWFTPAICKALELRVDFDAFVSELTAGISEHEELYQQIKVFIENPEASQQGQREFTGAKNIIVYGAPGTGKSYSFKDLPNVVRTVFHSEYRNSDFIGAYKPYRIVSAEGETITYEFIPGPFIQAFVNAVRNPTEQHNFIIEEINRADASAVFGEVFQLLDRSETGQSLYDVNVDAILADYLSEQLKGKWCGKLYIPANLYLRASMNSADQGVQPMDSAFKRRWEFKYLPINFDASEPLFNTRCIPYRSNIYTWRAFATAINKILLNNGIQEDRLLGPYFLSKTELADTAGLTASVSGKVFIYLWDDVLRHVGRVMIFDPCVRSFAELIFRYERNERIFSADVERLLAAELDNQTDETDTATE